MKYDSHIAQDGVVVQLLDIFSADQHLALLHIIEAGDQFDYGALAGAGLSHQGQPLSVPDLEIDALQHIGFVIVGKPYIPQFNIMALGEIRAALIDGDIQDFLRFGDRVQHIGEIGPQLLQRTDLRQVHGPHIEEQQERAGCQGAFQEKHPAQRYHEQHPALNDDHEGRVGRSHAAGGLVPHGVFLMDGGGEFLEGFAPHVICLDELHAADILDHDRVQRGDGTVGPVHQVVRIAEHNRHHQDRKHQRHQGNQSQRDIDGHQIGKNHHRPHQIAHQIRQVVGQKQLQLLNVLIQHGFDVSGPPLVQRPQRHLSHVFRYHTAHLEQRAVGSLVGYHSRCPEQHKAEHHRRSHSSHDPHHQFFGTGPAKGGIHQPVNFNIGHHNAQAPGHRQKHGQEQPYLLLPGPVEKQGHTIGFLLFHRLPLLSI